MYPITHNNISINSQLSWIFKNLLPSPYVCMLKILSILKKESWIFKCVLELIECNCVYYLICNMMTWHVKIGGVKLGFYTTPLLNLTLYALSKYKVD